ncbi:EAL domain, c-di-GMP-specific phosphodiesterase class I (or its enzymatically inactive variant) [Tindallia magadiensis]|uniref:EAL domain, c-di-GMP-specific phosphodiesterase class I (Or its enzymatically inactive variant) n=1 Tax=Tindallia magadiensis TaxID=69895 RepID=A0A1I3EHY7_9FIRM|nr:EAL domain-containing protein [Tindallia magadiensis]SFH98483.1 EAL domain, c-di-GMP-specific phosphodiesterase class I (or its enzymatically inactive variant) [Tindallia magadiensis]
MAVEKKMPNTDYQVFKYILNGGKIHSLFQPIVSLRTGEVLGYEALSRGPVDSSFYRPDYLFEYAHRIGEVWKLDLLCREKAIDNGSRFIGKKKLFINIDPLSIRDPEFQRGFTKQKLKEFQLNCADIVMEITEKTAIKDYAAFNEMLNSYREQGYSVAVDDAGSGYSGLRTVAETRPEYIKIDMELVRNVDKDRLKWELLKSIRTFSFSAGIQLIAEGIETIDECKKLIELEIDYGQGYWLGKPEKQGKAIAESVKHFIIQWNQNRRKIAQYGAFFQVKDIAVQDQTLSVHHSVKDADALFMNNNHRQGVVILKEDRPVGLIMRNKLEYLRIKAENEIGLFLEKKVEEVMDEQPMIIPDFLSVKEASFKAITRKEENKYDYIVITREGDYYGIISIAALLETAAGCSEA